jgi:uncharacterized protein YeaO (DUF488 family)
MHKRKDSSRSAHRRKPALDLRLKRIYEAASPADGQRVLVDRLWPRGVARARAALDDWVRDVAPSSELRQWFGHDPARWPEFRRRYRSELRAHRAVLLELRQRAERGRLTLLYAAHDPRFNQAVVLKEMLAALRRC